MELSLEEVFREVLTKIIDMSKIVQHIEQDKRQAINFINKKI